MIGSWIARLRKSSEPAQIAPDRPVYAVGDLHGRSDLLDRMLGRISDDAAQHGLTDPDVVFLGDYVDRGEDSAGVIARVRAEMRAAPHRVFALMGNHEAMMLAWLDDPVGGRRWLRFGGLQTLASYGVGGLSERSGPSQLEEGATALANALPEGEVHWLRSLRALWRSGNLACVHAGADPAIPLEDQEHSTLIWGHKAFLQSHRRDGHWVVHGHTVVDAPYCEASRIGIDTGAYFSDRLSACRITPDGRVGFLDVRP